MDMHNSFAALAPDTESERTESSKHSVCSACEVGVTVRHLNDGTTLAMDGCQLHVWRRTRLEMYVHYRAWYRVQLTFRIIFAILRVPVTLPMPVSKRIFEFLYRPV